MWLNKDLNVEHVLENLLKRSTCSVRVAALLVDKDGSLLANGWNHAGPDGFGEHAEAHCLRRANRRRLEGATLYVAATRSRNGKPVLAKPCPKCEKLVRKCFRVIYRDNLGDWRAL